MKKCHIWCYEDKDWLLARPRSQEAARHIFLCEQCGVSRGWRPEPSLGNCIILLELYI